MAATVTRHPLLQAFYDARKGEPISAQIVFAHSALLKEIVFKGGVISFHPLELASKYKVDSLAVSKLFGWWIEAGYVEKISAEDHLKFRLSKVFCDVHGVHYSDIYQ